ncbi:CRISPR-associated protein Csx11 [Persephonella sp.]
MSGLDLNKLKQYRDEILKAEIISMFSLVEKTFPDWWKNSNHGGFYGGTFSSNVNISVKNILENLLNDIETEIKTTKNIKIKGWDDFINEFRKWRNLNLNNNNEKILQVIYGVSEGLNSGIDKGSPKEHMKGGEPFLSNAFGTSKFVVTEDFMDSVRKFVLENQRDPYILDNIKEVIKSNLGFIPENVNKALKNLHNETLENIIIKVILTPELKEKYSSYLNLRNIFYLLYRFIPADSRIPVNDVSLWDQTYMSASMFKAKFFEFIYLTEKNQWDLDQVIQFANSHRNFKWRILGIQYDKMGLAEKGFKLASIKWYRDITKKIDEEIKKILEVEYPIGNEIYRDETGIYFIVGEDLGKDLNDRSNLSKLDESLSELENKIFEIFKDKLYGEIYPYISLTKASRGLMNLSTLLGNARENFLRKNTDLIKFQEQELEKYFLKRKVSEIEELENYPVDENTEFILKRDKEKIPKKCEKEKGLEYNFAIGVCPICQLRLIFKSDKCKNNSPIICEVCDRRIHHSQVASWIDNISGETIWIDEIKDKNNRVAYISLKFELEDWLSGDLLNSLLVREKEDKYMDLVNDTEQLILRDKKLNEGKIKNYIWGIPTSIKMRQFITSWLLERSIGQKWEEFIKSNFSNPNAIDFEGRKIYWNLLNDRDIEFLTELILQFLLRKNPSPARLRRIWETTQEFFEKIHKNLNEDLEIPEWRKKRLVWEVECGRLEGKKSQELEGSNLLFWMEKITDENLSDLPEAEKEEKLRQSKKAKIYLISSIADFIEKFGNESVKEELNKKDKEIDKDKIKTLFKENFEIKLKKHFENKNKGEGETLITITKDNPLEIHSYKTYSLITDISPVNYQIVIPAEYLPNFIDKVLELYNKNFKYVYGKLPIHIGIIVANYKKPLYVNLKALRKIRKDVKDTEKLWINEDTGKFCQLQKEKLSYAELEENINNTENYYALYFNNLNEKDYNFYIKPNNEWKFWISTLNRFSPNSKVKIIPNTFDFEFMDTNIRRNDIYYDENKHYKRAVNIKSNRPYELEVYWNKFKVFHELFRDKTNTAKMHKLVSLFYEKLQDYDNRYNPLLASAIIDILELKKNKDAKKYISQIFDLDESASNFQQELIDKLNEEKLKLFIDMFEFWHTALKEV